MYVTFRKYIWLLKKILCMTRHYSDDWLMPISYHWCQCDETIEFCHIGIDGVIWAYVINCYYICQVNGVKLADILFSLLCVCVSVSTQSFGLNGVLFAEKCIRLVCEKLTVFPNGKYIVGIYDSLAFWRYSQVQDRSGGLWEMYKMSVPLHRCCGGDV